MKSDSVLVICDGDLPALTACAAVRIEHSQHGIPPRDAGSIVWMPWSDDSDHATRVEASSACASHCDFIFAQGAASKAESVWPGEGETRMLLDASAAAVRRGIARVIWPVQHLGDGSASHLDVAARAVDRALLVTRLVALDADAHELPSFRIETPYADLTDRQMAELAADLDAPAWLCWWLAKPPTQRSSAAQQAAARWTTLLEEAGISLTQRE